jgi:DNA-binding response OmpR family regulator
MFHISEKKRAVNPKSSCKMKRYDILIVDDEQRYASMLASRLTLRGLACKVRYDGRTAIDILEKVFFPWVILDLRLPDLYGSEVLSRIRTISPETKVIILTGHGTEKDRTVCLSLGAYSFLNKPVNIEKMIAIMGQDKG